MKNSKQKTKNRSEEITQSEQSLTNRFLTFIKLAGGLTGGGLALISAMGFPAVLLQFYHFNIPTQFLSYDQAIKAGVLPAVLLALICLYIYWAAKQLRKLERNQITPKVEARVLYLPGMLFMPIALGTVLIFVTMYVSVCTLFIWGVLWIISKLGVRWIVLQISNISLTNRNLMCVAVIIFILVFIIIGIKTLISFIKSKKISKHRKISENEKISVNKKRKPDFKTRMVLKLFDKLSSDNVWERLKAVPVIFGLIMVFCAASLYYIKLWLLIWDPNISRILMHGHILLISGVCALTYGCITIFIACADLVKSKNSKTRREGFLIVIIGVLLIYLVSVSVYSYKLYPIIPRGLGGGKPESIVFWLKNEDFPMELPEILSKSKFRKEREGRLIKCEAVYLIYAGSEILIISDGKKPPSSGFIVSRDIIKIISW